MFTGGVRWVLLLFSPRQCVEGPVPESQHPCPVCMAKLVELRRHEGKTSPVLSLWNERISDMWKEQGCFFPKETNPPQLSGKVLQFVWCLLSVDSSHSATNLSAETG